MGILFNDKPRYGCGSGIFYVKDKVFYEACKQHDIDYVTSWGDRDTADSKFLAKMDNLAETNWDNLRKYIYYIIVRVFWGIFWQK